VLDTVLQAKTVLAGVKTLALVLNRVLVACIAAACNFFFLGHLGHMTSLIHHISHHFENRNNCFQGNVIAMLRALGILMLRHLRRVSISNRESILLAQIFCTTGFFGLHIGTSGLEKKIRIIGVSFIYASLKTLRFTV